MHCTPTAAVIHQRHKHAIQRNVTQRQRAAPRAATLQPSPTGNTSQNALMKQRVMRTCIAAEVQSIKPTSDRDNKKKNRTGTYD